MNVVATLPGPIAGSQGSVGSNFVNNQLGATAQHGIGNSQGSKGDASYLLFPGRLEGSPACVRAMWNPFGWGENVLTDPLVADRAGEGVQVSLSLFPSVSYSDRRASIDNAQSQAPVQQYLRPPSWTKKPHQ